MKCSICALVVALCTTISSAQADIIYTADFTGSQGVSHNTGSPAPSGPRTIPGPNWALSYNSTPSTDSTTNFARAAGSKFETEDWGGEAQVISEAIDVSLATEATITWDGQTVGSSVFNNTGGGERFEWFYVLDGSRVTQTTTSDGSLDRVIAGIDTSSASVLEVGFLWNVNGAGDGFDIFELSVDAEIIPEPTSILMLSIALGCVSLVRTRK